MKKLVGILLAILIMVSFALAENPVFAFEKAEYDVATKEQLKLKPVAQGISGKLSYEWLSSNEEIATVKNGTVKGISVGNAVITCIAKDKNENEFKASCTVNVIQKITSIKADVNKLTMAANSGWSDIEPTEDDERFFYTPVITIQPEDATNTKLEWSSSDPFVAKVDENGRISSGYMCGTTKITGTATDGSKKKVVITVTIPKVYVTADSIVVDTEDGVEFGYQMNASGISTSGTRGDCFYTESMDDVGGIDMNRIMPVKAGSGSFVIRSGGQTKTVKITVKDSAVRSNKTYPAKSVADLLDMKDESYGTKTNFKIQSIIDTQTGDADELIYPYVANEYAEMYSTAFEKSISIVQADSKNVEYWAVIHNKNVIPEESKVAYGTIIGYMPYISETGLEYECPIMYDAKYKDK